MGNALTIAKQVDYLGGIPTAAPKSVKVTADSQEMLRADLTNETETIRNYRDRVRQCEQLGEFAMAELIREILVPGARTFDRSGHGAWRKRPAH